MPERTKVVIIRPESRIFAVAVTLAWIVFLFYLAGLPRLPYVPVVPIRAVSPLAHYGTFAVLASLGYLVVAPRPSHLAGRVQALATAIAVSMALALALEGVQYFLPLRSPELDDLLYNAAGAGTGAIAMLLLDQLTVGRHFLSLMTAGVVLVLVAMTATSIAVRNPSHPWVGDHWHARYQISVCGAILPPLAGTHGSVHTHGGGLIHIHPVESAQAGANANLALFFATSGGKLADHSLTLPSGGTYGDGEQCSNGQPGHLAVTVNGNTLDRPSSYVMRNGDEISIEFKADE